MGAAIYFVHEFQNLIWIAAYHHFFQLIVLFTVDTGMIGERKAFFDSDISEISRFSVSNWVSLHSLFLSSVFIELLKTRTEPGCYLLSGHNQSLHLLRFRY